MAYSVRCGIKFNGTWTIWTGTRVVFEVTVMATHLEEIKAMTLEEMTEFLLSKKWTCYGYDNCNVCPLKKPNGMCATVKEWLESEHE